MNIPNYFYKLSFGLFVLALVGLFIPQTVFCQTEKLGIVNYTPPKGWKKTPSENIVTFSELNEATGHFCTITLYGATPGTGTPQSDFAREWDNLVVKPFKGDANPKTEIEAAAGWTAIAGGAAVDFQGSKALALLTVFSHGSTTVSVLGIFNDEAYGNQLTAFLTGMNIDKPIAVNPPPQPEEPLPQAPAATAATMHAAALVREFENNEIRANQLYVGKRMRIYGTVNVIEINRDGQIVLTFKSSITTSRNARCYFNKSQSSRVAAINAHEEATVEGTVKGLGDGFDNSKAYLVLENCTVP